MNILHTEASNNWGGQEIRILKESMGLRSRGHTIIFVIQKGGVLAQKAREAGFIVYELNFKKINAFFVIFKLLWIFSRHKVGVVNTHSSIDAWLGGIAARFKKIRVVRTRHLSTPIRAGLNSCLLYKALADYVVTTSSSIIPLLKSQAKIDSHRTSCVPTGVDPFEVGALEVSAFRKELGLKEGDILVGTACVVRSWKGIQDLMKAAHLLRHHTHLKWVVVGGGYIDQYKDLIDLKNILVFTGHLENPYVAMAAMDIFLLLSTANEGISQATLQAAYLRKPLVTTSIGGLPEVCLDEKTGLIVPPHSPHKVVEAVLRLSQDPLLRERMGEKGRALVEEKFLMKKTLDEMERIFCKFPSVSV